MLTLEEIKINMKIQVKSLQNENDFAMIVHQINGTEITAVLKQHAYHDPARFTFYAKGAQFLDGTGKSLIVERFQR